jgi:hypothetical protein
MLHLAMAALLFGTPSQDPAPARTLEDRLKELEAKLVGLEKRHETLQGENQALEKKLADAKAARQAYVNQMSEFWIGQYGKEAEFTETQKGELRELWKAWTSSDLDRPADLAAWKSREEALKGKLTSDQLPKVMAVVRREQAQMATFMIQGLALRAKLSPEHVAPFEQAVLSKFTYPEGVVLSQAHPEAQSAWVGINGIVEKLLPDLASSLGDQEVTRLRALVVRPKPGQ